MLIEHSIMTVHKSIMENKNMEHKNGLRRAFYRSTMYFLYCSHVYVCIESV